MNLLGWAIWVIGLVFGLSWGLGVRTCVRSGQGVSQQTVNQAALMVLAAIAVPVLGISRFHVLWMIPAAFVIGRFSLTFPFSLASLIGKPFGILCCLGLNRREIERRQGQAERFRELVAAGAAPDEARRQAELE